MFSRMFSFRALLGASVCLLPLLPLTAAADDFDVDDKPAEAVAAPPSQNWITIGGQYSSGRSDFINRFSGTESPGFQALGDFRYGTRDAWDTGGTHYFNLQGDRLGTPDRSLSAKAGEQGIWGAYFGYDGIYYDGGHNYHSIYDTNANLQPGLAPGSLTWGYSQFVPGSGVKLPLWQPYLISRVPVGTYQLDMQRDIYTAGGKYQVGDWLITSGWRHEHKQGYQQQSLTFYGAPSLATSSATKPTTFTSGLAYFLQPVNYDTDRFEIAAAYNTRLYQGQLSFNYSQFDNNNGSVQLMNPWAFSGIAAPASAATTGAIYVLPPNNSAYQVKGSFGMNLPFNSRLNVNAGYGVNVQNTDLMAGTGSANIPSATLPRAQFQGFAENIFGNVALTSHPISNLDLRVAYTLSARDDESSKNIWTSYPVSSSTYYTYPNVPVSLRHQTLVGEVGYRVYGQTKLTLTDTLEDMYRSYSAARDVQSNTIQLKVRGPVIDGLYASLSGAYQNRWASPYNPNATWNYTNATAKPDTANEPTNLIMFYEASRKHAEVKGMLDATPFDGVSVSLFGKISRDTYPSRALGMRNNRNISAGPDLGWEVSKDLQVHAFYTYQQLYFDESALWASGSGSTGYSVPYQLNNTNSVQTVGVSADWQAIPEKLKVSLDGNLSVGDTAYGLGEGVAVVGAGVTSWATIGAANFTPLPDVKSTLITVTLKGEYTISAQTTLLVGYTFERFNYKDFMYGTGATQYANAFVPGTMNPNESVHVLSAAVRMRF